jgi:hypothetical protein
MYRHGVGSLELGSCSSGNGGPCTANRYILRSTYIGAGKLTHYKIEMDNANYYLFIDII